MTTPLTTQLICSQKKNPNRCTCSGGEECACIPRRADLLRPSLEGQCRVCRHKMVRIEMSTGEPVKEPEPKERPVSRKGERVRAYSSEHVSYQDGVVVGNGRDKSGPFTEVRFYDGSVERCSRWAVRPAKVSASAEVSS